MTPLGRGVNRDKWDWYGFGTPDNSFWCCYGTSVEQFAKMSDSIFFHAAAPRVAPRSAPPTLYVAQYLPATLSWDEHGVSVGIGRAAPTLRCPSPSA